MASKITIKRSLTAAAPAGLSFGEMAFVQGSGLTANQLYVGISGGNPAWVGAQIGTTGTWTDNAAQTSLATQYAIEQRIGAKISAQTAGVSSFNGVTGAVTGVSSFNGLTGAVSGVTTSVANTFTALQTFSAGISTSGGTFGTPTQLVGTNITGIASALTAGTVTTNANLTGAITSSGNGTTLGSFTSAQLSQALTDNTGSGVAVFDTNPNFTTSLTTNSATLALFNSGFPTTLNGFGAATTMTLGATSGNAVIRNPTLILGNTTGTITTGLGNLTLVPAGTIINDGDIASLTITNTESVGQVQIEGGDLFLGNKSDGTTTTPVNIIFEGASANNHEITLTVTDPTADRTITLPDATGTVALTQTSVASFNGATGAVTGVSSFNGLTGAVSGVGSIVAGTGISISGPTGAVTVNSTYVPALATTGVTGVASFDSGDFAVSGAGAVTIKASGVGNAQLENPNITINGALIALGTTYNFKISEFGSASSAELAAKLSDTTGTTGGFVRATGPTISAPVISSDTIKNSLGIAAAIPILGTMSAIGGGDTFVLLANTQTLTNKTLTGATLTSPSLGTPTLLVGTNITGTASGLTAGRVTTNADLTGAITSVGNGTTLGSFSSAQLATALTDETGSGANVFGTSPAITTSLTTPSTSFDLLNTTATTVNFAGAGLTLNIGNASGTATFGGNVIVNGDFTVQGNTTTLNTTTLNVEDFNITMGLTLTNATQCTGAGIGIGVGTGITFAYDHGSLGWLSSVNMDLASGKVFKIGNASVLSGTTLGSLVVASSLTSVGTLLDLTVTNTINGSVTGNAGTATTATNANNIAVALDSSDTTCFITFVNTSSGNQATKVNSTLTYNALSGELSATLIDGGTF